MQRLPVAVRLITLVAFFVVLFWLVIVNPDGIGEWAGLAFVGSGFVIIGVRRYQRLRGRKAGGCDQPSDL
jgi:hypothetical protein